MQQLTDRISRIQVSHISDAMGRTGVPAGLSPISRGAMLLGEAFTVRAHPGDNLALHWAITQAVPGQIIVVDGGGLKDIALWGELMSLAAQAQGIAGLVIDGAVRDVDAMDAIGFPVYARAVTPRGPFKASRGELQVPISCGGVPVLPGDWIVGDNEGVVVIPRTRLEEVVAAAEALAEREMQFKERMAQGERLFDLLKLPVS